MLSLYELNNLVRSCLENVMPDTYWVRAELSEVRVSRGHCYLEFVQKSERGDGLVAKARGQVWANRWNIVRPYFERTTGRPLSPGMQVLVCVGVTFHELYGYSLNVVDIDPTFTLGDIARRRQEILKQLEQEGVLTMNKELSLPRLLQRVAVISSVSAAGYGDFCNQLTGNVRGLCFRTKLFPAVMQGDGVEASVIAALNDIAAEMDEWDAVVIIRGGGSTSDLAGFDTLALAENVAQFPLPVITGIGHERDDTVIDVVAHTRVKTPTAAAEFLIHHLEAELDLVERLTDRLTSASRQTLHAEQVRHQRICAKLPSLFSAFRLREENRLERLMGAAANGAVRYVERRKSAVEMFGQRLEQSAKTMLVKENHRLVRIADKTELASPERVLRLGYSITRINGHAVTDASGVKVGDTIVTTLANGEIRSEVKR